MPTIEIASIDSKELGLNQADFEVAIIEESKLKSHRGLFFDFLKKQNGAIVHIGNPNFKDNYEGFFFAGQIVDWDFDSCDTIYIPEYGDSGANQQLMFKFLNQFTQDIDKLLKISLEKSPAKKIYFLSDYQFGPEKEEFESVQSMNEFWDIHDTEGLRFNTIYEIYDKSTLVLTNS